MPRSRKAAAPQGIDKIRAFDPEDLSASEWMALADHAETERWVWDKMATAGQEVLTPEQEAQVERIRQRLGPGPPPPTDEERVRHRERSDFYRDRARMFREFAAIEEAEQERFEAEKAKEASDG